jgi:hypothetical protein
MRREQAAEDWLQALRASVASGTLPGRNVLEALVRAVAYRRGLDPAGVVPARLLLDVLVKEVMDSPFLPADRKGDLAKELIALGEEFHAPVMSMVEPPRDELEWSRSLPFAALGAACIGTSVALSIQFHSVVPWAIGLGAIIYALAIVGFGAGRMDRIAIGPVTISRMVTDEKLDELTAPPRPRVQRTPNSEFQEEAE